jgi:hypothetical protein
MFNRSPRVRAQLAERLGRDLLRRRAVVEVPLASYGALRFDGASRIDVALVDDELASVLACEAKLGATRLGGKLFEERFLAGCGTSHGGARVRGSMPAILERRLPAVASDVRLTARAGDQNLEVELRWALVVRRRTAEDWDRGGRPALSSRCVVVVFDDLVEAYGGREPFNALVCDLLDRDHFTAWLG